MPETFDARVGQITIGDKTIVLKTPHGQQSQWPPTFSDLPLDTFNKHDAAALHAEAEANEKVFPKVIKAVLRRNPKYKKHPVVKRWIEHNKETIAILRSLGFRDDDPRIKRAEKQLLHSAGRQSLRAAKRPYKSINEQSARREAELLKALKPVYNKWRKALDSGCSRDQRAVQKSAPSGYATAFATNYDATRQSEIEKWIRIFEDKRDNLEGDEKLTLEKIIHSHLEKEFAGRVSLGNIRRGRQRMKQNRKNTKNG